MRAVSAVMCCADQKALAQFLFKLHAALERTHDQAVADIAREVCGDLGDEAHMLICSGRCARGFHMRCHAPAVPTAPRLGGLVLQLLCWCARKRLPYSMMFCSALCPSGPYPGLLAVCMPHASSYSCRCMCRASVATNTHTHTHTHTNTHTHTLHTHTHTHLRLLL